MQDKDMQQQQNLQHKHNKGIHHLKFDDNQKFQADISADGVGFQEDKQNCIQEHKKHIFDNQEETIKEVIENEDKERKNSMPHLDFDIKEGDNITFVGKKTYSPRIRSISRASNSSLQEIQESNEEQKNQKGHRINTSRSHSRSRSRFSTSPRNKTNGEQQLENKLNKIEEEIQIMSKDSPKNFNRQKSDLSQGFQQAYNEEDEDDSEPEPIMEKDEELIEDKPSVREHRNSQLGINLKKFEEQTNKIEVDELDTQEFRKRENSLYNNQTNNQEQPILEEEDEKSSNLENL